jgi:heme/copper-type cytochrome/quinol oxidase subunit 3
MSMGHPDFETQGAVRRGNALDVSGLPSYAYGHRSLMWWGTWSMIAVEATVFALAIMAYFYIRSQAREWPPGVAPPDLLWGTVNTFILVASGFPNHWAKKAAERRDLPQVRLWLSVCLAFSVAFIVVRFLEYTVLNVRWDTNAYGSIVWILLSLHFTHLLTDFFDSAVLTALMFGGPLDGRRFVDVAESGMYWYFVVITWIPIYLTIYWVPQG